MSTTSPASSTYRKYIVRPLDGENQVYENLPADATVRDLKERIFVAEGTPIEDQKLIYGAVIMEDSRTLESFNIRKGFVIRLLAVVHQPPPAAQSSPCPQPNSGEKILDNVFVISGNGATINMGPVKLLITVGEFREQYCSRRGQEAEFCRLVYLGKQLEDKKDGVAMTLKDYDVQNNSNLHEFFRVPGG